MTEVAEFIIGILGRVLSGVFTAYIIRLFDKLTKKNNRPDHFCVNKYIFY